MSRAGFADGLRRDAQKRLRQAILALTNRAIDAEVERWSDGEPRSSAEVIRLDGLARNLRFTLALFCSTGHLHLGQEDEEALREAEQPRRPSKAAEKPSAAPRRRAHVPELVAPAAAPALPRARQAPRALPSGSRQVPLLPLGGDR